MSRKAIFSLLPIFCIMITAQFGFAVIDPNSVVAIWLCDEGDGDTVADASGNGYDGTFVGNVDWADGQFGMALEFSGTAGSRVEIPHDDALTLEKWTITAWAKLSPAPDWTVIVVKAQGNGTQNYSLDLDGGGRVFSEVTSGGGWSDCGSTTTIYDEVWHFAAASYDGSTLRVYVDGKLEGEQNFPPGDVSTAPLTIGGRTDGSQPLIGITDDIGLFNTALSEGDLQNIMNNGLSVALGLAAVEPGSKLTTTWGQIKQK